MTDTVARLRRGSKQYEIVVDLDEALKIKKGESEDISSTLLANNIFYNTKDGSIASQSDLQEAFSTTDINEVATVIIKKGEIDIKPSEFAQLQKVKWEILTPKTISQYNFMKQENNVKLQHPEAVVQAIEQLKRLQAEEENDR